MAANPLIASLTNPLREEDDGNVGSAPAAVVRASVAGAGDGVDVGSDGPSSGLLLTRYGGTAAIDGV